MLHGRKRACNCMGRYTSSLAMDDFSYHTPEDDQKEICGIKSNSCRVECSMLNWRMESIQENFPFVWWKPSLIPFYKGELLSAIHQVGMVEKTKKRNYS